MAKKLPLSEQSLEEQFGKRFVKTINALKKKSYPEHVLTACNIGPGAFFRRNPEIRRTGIKNDIEFLWWSSNCDWSVVLRIHVVVQRLIW
jgi:hypothetical protein